MNRSKQESRTRPAKSKLAGPRASGEVSSGGSRGHCDDAMAYILRIVLRPVMTWIDSRRIGGFVLALAGCVSAQADERPQWIPGWRETAPLTTPRAGAAVIRIGGYVYALGGVDGRRFLKSTEFSRIQSDGSLSPWQPTAPLTQARGFFAAVFYDGYLYAAGGGNGPHGENLLRSMERAPVRDDGRLGTWQRVEVELTYPRRCVKLALVGRSLYALGGFGGVLLDSVEKADFLPDGRLGPFSVEEHAFAIPRYIHTEQTTDRAVYVLGGHDQREGRGLADVEYAVNGSKLRWRPAAPMVHPRYALSSTVLGDGLYALGGLDGPIYMDSVEVSRIGEDGSLGPWRETTPLSSPRANFGTFEVGNRVYVVGGTNRDGYFRTVEYAERNADGDLGFWGNANEAEAYKGRRAAARTGTHRVLPNEGVVREIIQTEAYSYMRVAGPGDERWIAAPRADYKVNERIRYSQGTAMGNFYSRALGRSFDSILFVERTERE
jgi:hypothetical protein